MNTTPQRSDTQDIAKAFGIFAVVFVHTWRGLISLGVFDPSNIIDYIDKAGMLYAMPVFFLLAGHNTYASLQRTKPLDFIVKRAKVIVPIYFFWSIVQAFLHSLKNDPGNSGTSHNFWETISTIWYHPIDQFWFLYGLMIYHILTALLQKRLPVLITIMVAAYLYNSFVWPLFIQEMTCCGIFYLFGYLVARNGPIKLQEMPLKLMYPLLFGIWVTGTVLANQFMLDPRTPPLFTALMCSSSFILLFSYKLNNSWIGTKLAVIGRASLAIYVMHVICFAGTRVVLFKLGITDGYMHLVLETLAGLFGPMAVYFTLRRFNLTRYAFLG
jgi:fucose 4-O-acetylase-like acetyltransferase